MTRLGGSAHAIVYCGIRVVVGVAVGAHHIAMIVISPMGPTVWLSISVDNVLRSSSSARAAGAVGRASVAGFIAIPMVLVASSLLLLLLISPLLPCPSAIIVVVLIIIICLGGCGILGRSSVCICCYVLLHHD